MESQEYQTLFQYETGYWWFKGLHKILLETLGNLDGNAGLVVLDAGCGTGQNLVNVRDQVTSWAFGLDVAAETLPFWRQRELSTVCCASVNEIPFASQTFDVVMSVDVLECTDVRQEQAYEEMWRVMRPGGHLILVVPAYDWLMSYEHHRAVQASRRYTRRRLSALLKRRPVDVIRMTHLFATLLPAVAAYRLLFQHLTKQVRDRPRSELRPLPQVINDLLLRTVDMERLLLRIFDLPFGSSILTVARKVGT